jgi:hypothetical protein
MEASSEIESAPVKSATVARIRSERPEIWCCHKRASVRSPGNRKRLTAGSSDIFSPLLKIYRQETIDKKYLPGPEMSIRGGIVQIIHKR